MTTGRNAVSEFYLREHLPADGGVTDWLVWVTAFGIPLAFPNIPARRALLPYHDLHHIVTGYHTDEVGECEAGAWCLGTGGGPLLGFVYDLHAFGLGLVRFPRRTVRAFHRGRQCRNLYRRPAEAWLSGEVAEVFAETGTRRPMQAVTAADRVALAVYAALAAVVSLGAPALLLALAALALA